MGSSPRAVRHAGADPVTATMTLTSHSCHAGQATKPTTSPRTVLPRRLCGCPRPKITRDRPHLSPELAPSPLGRSCVILTGHAHACHGPRRGRELTRISGQQRTTTDNDITGQPACRLAARPPGPRLQRSGPKQRSSGAHDCAYRRGRSGGPMLTFGGSEPASTSAACRVILGKAAVIQPRSASVSR
jgi:hypothetical protein